MSTSDTTTFTPTTRHDTYPAIDPAKADLTGKVVLIAGASRGIGKATALAAAQAGARGLVLFARSDLSAVKQEALSLQRAGSTLEVLALPVDITNHGQVTAALKQVEQTFGRLDIVVNNAGHLNQLGPMGLNDPDEWWTTWTINIRGTYNVVRASLPLLIESGGDKTIITVSSRGAVMMLPGASAYSVTKLALLRLTEYINVEYGDQGVLAYSIHPGGIDTEMNSILPQEIKAMLTDTVELPGHTIVWLAQERREWLAGRYIDCNWDMEEFLAKKDEIVAGDKLKCKLVM